MGFAVLVGWTENKQINKYIVCQMVLSAMKKIKAGKKAVMEGGVSGAVIGGSL